MTGTEIIAQARLNFGETTALTLQDVDFEGWLATALGELYELLPADELLPLAETTSVPLDATGNGTLPADLDRLLSAAQGGTPITEVTTAWVQAIDVNPFYAPVQRVFATDGENLWVRGPEVGVAVDVTHIDPPAAPTLLGSEVVLPKWHPALVLFVTAFAYAQEEDKGQAQHYRNEALALINRTSVAPEQEAL